MSRTNFLNSDEIAIFECRSDKGERRSDEAAIVHGPMETALEAWGAAYEQLCEPWDCFSIIRLDDGLHAELVTEAVIGALEGTIEWGEWVEAEAGPKFARDAIQEAIEEEEFVEAEHRAYAASMARPSEY